MARSFPDPAGRGALDRIQRPVHPIGEVGRHGVDPFELRRGQRRRAPGVAPDCVEMLDQRAHLALDVGGSPLDAAGQPAGGDQDCDLNNRRGEGRRGDHAEEDDAPIGHACSRARAC